MLVVDSTLAAETKESITMVKTTAASMMTVMIRASGWYRSFCSSDMRASTSASSVKPEYLKTRERLNEMVRDDVQATAR